MDPLGKYSLLRHILDLRALDCHNSSGNSQIYYDLYFRDSHKGTPNFGKPPNGHPKVIRKGPTGFLLADGQTQGVQEKPSTYLEHRNDN